MKTLFVLIILIKTVFSQINSCENMIKVNSTEPEIKSLIESHFESIKEDPK